ncbi:MAG: flagellar hook-basal body complex protein FliE, partial [Lachnospiraceae bacterium]
VNTKDNSFGGALKSAMELLNETSNLQNKAEEAEIQFALGNATSTHDLQAAQEKATIALSYTVAVRDRMLEAYKEIMNMQI